MSDTSNPAVSLHSLRRTTATILAENVSVIAVQYYLGHVQRGASLKYIYPSQKNFLLLVETMSKHFEKIFYESELEKIY